MSNETPLGQVQCPMCGALVDVFGPKADAELGFGLRDADLCRSPPIPECGHVRAEIDRVRAQGSTRRS